MKTATKKTVKRKKSATQVAQLKKREHFLEVLADSCNISWSCKLSGLPRRTAYFLRDKDEKFAQEWEDAIEQGIEALEMVARERAKHQSDTLMIFLLKAHRPDKYRERQDINQNITGSLTIEVMKFVKADCKSTNTE